MSTHFDMASFFIVLVIFLGLFLFGALVFTRMKIKRMKEELLSRTRNDFLRFFAPGEKLSGSQVSMRIQERTGGRRGVSDFAVYEKLDELVEQGYLCSEQKNVKLYFLP